MIINGHKWSEKKVNDERLETPQKQRACAQKRLETNIIFRRIY
jgi:hypothetical protein